MNISERVKSGTAGTLSIINAGIKSFLAGASGIHNAACAALFHALERGDTRPLDKVFASVSATKPKDAALFRQWIGDKTKIMVEDQDGHLRPKMLLKITDDNGVKTFKFSEGVSENMRVGILNFDNLLSSSPFYKFEKEKNKEEKDFGTLELLKSVNAFVKSVNKKATDNGLTIPPVVMEALKEVSKSLKGFDIELMEFEAKREKRMKAIEAMMNAKAPAKA